MEITGAKVNMLKFLRFYNDDDYSRFDKWFLAVQIKEHKHIKDFHYNLKRFNLTIKGETT